MASSGSGKPNTDSADEPEQPESAGERLWILVKYGAIGCGGWLAVDAVVHRLLLRTALYRGYKPLERLRFKSYVTSCLNALLLFGWSARRTWQDWCGVRSLAEYVTLKRPAAIAGDDYERRRRRQLGLSMIALFWGEMLHDTLVSVPLIVDRPPEMIHHGAGLVVLSALTVSGAAGDWFHRLLIVELSTIVMDLLWILRATGVRSPRLHLTLSFAFVATFFATRVVHLPVMAHAMITRDPMAWALWQRRHLFKVGVLSGILLQFYWFALLARGFVRILKRSV